MAMIYIDSKAYEVRDGLNLLDACLSLGFDIPYFCWHPALGSVGACRQCAVKQFKDEHDTRGKIVMSCMTPAADGTRISIDDPEVRAFRATVIEWLMVNHPHDCPVCDEGGECHLQDMTVMTGHTYRRFRFKKRTHRNQYLGPFINHEMNRCIQCYRCVQFYREYAGGRDFDVFAAHDHVYYGRHEQGILESEFSGNLVEICPTGVFTDKTFKSHYTRKWDLRSAPSVCVHCGLGCNTIPAERYGTLRRIHNRYNGEVNRYFLCDRGRFGYGFVNSESRIRTPLVRIVGGSSGDRERGLMRPATADEVLKRLRRLFYLGAKVTGIGSPRASLEANFALRTLVGPRNFYFGVSEKEHRMIAAANDVLTKGSARSPSLRDIELADAVFVLGEDVTNTAPMLDLAIRRSLLQKPLSKSRELGIPDWQTISVRDAIQDERGPLFIATPSGTKLDEMATKAWRGAPDDIASLGFAVSRILKAEAPDIASVMRGVETLAAEIARALVNSERPVVVCGTSCGSEAVVHAAADVAWALRSAGIPAQLLVTVPECNSLGLFLMGGGSFADLVHVAGETGVDTLIVLENDLYRRMDEKTLDLLFGSVKEVIVIDHLTNRTTSRADIVLPAGTFAESSGTLVNNEGRSQRFFQVFRPNGEIRESWRWVLEMLRAAQRPEASTWRALDDVTAAMAESMPIFSPVLKCAPPAGFRIAGMKIPREPHRYSGRTAMTAHMSVHEPSTPRDDDSPLSFSMEGFEGVPPSALITRFWAPGWNSVQSVGKFQREVGGPLFGGDPGQRLIEPGELAVAPDFRQVPGGSKLNPDEVLVIPVYHIFGSEELSVQSPSISALVPAPYLGLCKEDLDCLGMSEGDMAEIKVSGVALRLSVKILDGLTPGAVAVPSGLPGMGWVDLPSRCKRPEPLGGTGNTKKGQHDA